MTRVRPLPAQPRQAARIYEGYQIRPIDPDNGEWLTVAGKDTTPAPGGYLIRFDLVGGPTLAAHPKERIMSRRPPFCPSCVGRRWVHDENWTRNDGGAHHPRRPGDGLIPCGACNHGGWDIDEWSTPTVERD